MPTTSPTHRLRSALFALCVTAVPAAANAQGVTLTRTERAIVTAVDRRNADGLALLERLVNINSGTANHAGVRQVGALLRERLDALGFTTRWEDATAVDRAGHLVAEHRGPGPKLLLIGHLDTVFEPGSPFQRFERLNDTTARGPGVIDMKGGDVIILQALTALKEAGALDGMHVVAYFSGDEEDAGRPLTEARRVLREVAQGAIAAIGLENGGGDPATAVVARRGATNWTLRTTGTAGHASQIFREDIGAGAVFEASRILTAFYTTLAGEPLLAFNPGLILGGSNITVDAEGAAGTADGKHNVIARDVVVTGDIRTISAEQLARTKTAMEKIVAQHLPHTTATITFDEGYPPLPPSAGNERLLAVYDRASRDLGTGPVRGVDPARAGAADVAFINGIVPMIIDGLGLSGKNDHSDKETADLRMLPVKSKRLAVMLLRLTQQEAPRP
ncbi:MAG: M20/M25/M40 family metallo-hydrolase [Gemmatimonadales bacterium]|nr:M20/M25/M40 family metallo-hydrolase [Gemmatimonadales bacterium]